MGLPLTDLFPELIGSEEELAAVARGQVGRFELPKINRQDPDSDAQRYLSLTAFPDPEAQRQMVLLVRDVTPEGRLEQQVMQQLNELRLLRGQLEAANRELVRLNEEKSAFVQMAAHDLRAPLTVIKGYVDLVARQNAMPHETLAEYLDILKTRIGAMTRLISDLLDVERIESGETALELEAVNLGELVEEVVQGFEPMADEKGLEVHWQVPSVPEIVADRDRLMQVLNNLISNAYKFTPPGGRVDVRVLVGSGAVIVEVIDTGPGIQEEDQARLFQRFFRTDDARLLKIPGTGLGLSIVRAIVEQHGGKAYCRSRVGEGSTFGFSMPLEAR
jgi:signal transduction histidine kinase